MRNKGNERKVEEERTEEKRKRKLEEEIVNKVPSCSGRNGGNTCCPYLGQTYKEVTTAVYGYSELLDNPGRHHSWDIIWTLHLHV